MVGSGGPQARGAVVLTMIVIVVVLVMLWRVKDETAHEAASPKGVRIAYPATPQNSRFVFAVVVRALL